MVFKKKSFWALICYGTKINTFDYRDDQDLEYNVHTYSLQVLNNKQEVLQMHFFVDQVFQCLLNYGLLLSQL